MEKKQFAVLGLGNFGYSVAKEMQKEDCEVIAVDHIAERVQAIADDVSYAMRADIGDQEVMRTLGARNLDGVVIAVAENMEASIMATLACVELGVPNIVAKANTEIHAKILEKIGVKKQNIVYPEKEMGKRVAAKMVNEYVTDLWELSDDYQIIGIDVPKAWVGKSLEDLDLRKVHDLNVVCVVKGDDVDVNPDPKKVLEEDSKLTIIGANDSLNQLKRKNQ